MSCILKSAPRDPSGNWENDSLKKNKENTIKRVAIFFIEFGFGNIV
jgi:hypothetical protein